LGPLVAAGAIALAAAVLGAHNYPRLLRFVAIYLALFGSVFGLLVIARSYRRGDHSQETRQRLLLAAVAATSAYSLSLSWPAWEPMILPGLAFVICEIDRRAASTRASWTGGLVLVCAVLIYDSSADKVLHPYGWAEWVEPAVFSATSAAKNQKLAGLSLSAPTVEFLDGIEAVIRRYSSPSDSIFVFPNMPIVYWLSERRASTFSVNYWFDVAPDSLSLAAVGELQASHPAVLVDFSISASEWRTNETVFRGGRPCGQRELHRALLEMASSSDYVKIAEMASPVTRNPVTVWVRRDRLAGNS
jgi:hypothetical protein